MVLRYHAPPIATSFIRDVMRYVTARRANHLAFLKTCPAVTAKINRFAMTPNQIYICRRPVPTRGALRGRHGRWKRDAVASGAIFCATNDAIADGEIAWSWRPDAGAKFVGYDPRMTVAKEPGHRGDRV